MKRTYFKMLKREESKKGGAATENPNLEPLGEKEELKKKADPVTAKKMAAAFEARKKEAERKQKKVTVPCLRSAVNRLRKMIRRILDNVQ